MLNMGATYSCVRSCFHMGGEEMCEVRQANRQSIENNLNILTFYYGKSDKWCPLHLYAEMKAFVETVEGGDLATRMKRREEINKKKKCAATIVLDEHGIDHAFVVFRKQCDFLANFISGSI